MCHHMDERAHQILKPTYPEDKPRAKGMGEHVATPQQKLRSVGARPGRLTIRVGRPAHGPNHLKSSLVASHMSSCTSSMRLSFWYVSLVLYVGLLIHVSLNSAF